MSVDLGVMASHCVTILRREFRRIKLSISDQADQDSSIGCTSQLLLQLIDSEEGRVLQLGLVITRPSVTRYCVV